MPMSVIRRTLSSQNDRGLWSGWILGMGTGLAFLLPHPWLWLVVIVVATGLSVWLERRLIRYRHRVRGTYYRELGPAILQTGRYLGDHTELVVYRAEDDGTMWARPVDEFHDGRFTRA